MIRYVSATALQAVIPVGPLNAHFFSFLPGLNEIDASVSQNAPYPTIKVPFISPSGFSSSKPLSTVRLDLLP